MRKTKRLNKWRAMINRPWRKYRSLVKPRPRWQRYAIHLITAALILISASWLLDKAWRPVKSPQYGVSFSIEYAKELGLDWRAAYADILGLDFEYVRLMTYWDKLEPKDDRFNFKDLDWQFEQAAKTGTKVSLAVGFRQPRWPECREPDFAKQYAINGKQWLGELKEYLGAVIGRYKNHPSLHSYQLENESRNNWFGHCRGSAAPVWRLNEEFDFMKRQDPGHPVFMSLSDQHGWPISTPVPDAYGFSIYRTVYTSNLPVHFYMTYPITVWYHRLRAAYIENIKDRPVFIHELQLEPWGPKATKHLPLSEQNKSMSPEHMRRGLLYARKTGIKTSYMWGAEWWYWRKVKFQDATPWNIIQTELQRAKSARN